MSRSVTFTGRFGRYCYRLRCLAEAFADKMESPRNSPLPILDCLVTIERLLRRADREAEGARLLSEYAPKGHLGFESPALRQYEFEEGFHLGPFFSAKNGDTDFRRVRRVFEVCLNAQFSACCFIRPPNYLSRGDVFYLLHYPVFLAVACLAIAGYESRCGKSERYDLWARGPIRAPCRCLGMGL